MSLWDEEECAAWHAALDRYPAAVAARGKEGLADLDAWYRTTLPDLIAGRTPPELLHDELVRVTRWKMQRGVWRERNWHLVRGNDEARVREVSAAAFAAVPDPRRPITLLSDLDGVGAATASAVMATYAPATYPFFDELVAAQDPDLGPVAFTIPYYLRYAVALRDRAARLSAACAHGAWTAQAVGLALWGTASAPIPADVARTEI